MTFTSANAPYTQGSFYDYPTYENQNLWTRYTPKETTFQLWSPVAEEVKVNFYAKGNGGKKLAQEALTETAEGLWTLTVTKDLHGVYYTYQVKVNGQWLGETPGIYAKAVGVNGNRAMVLDFSTTNPQGWEQDKGPALTTPNQAVLYELHVRDMTASETSGSALPGKFLGLVEHGTRNAAGQATGIDHLKELGITHVHLLPSFDFSSIDEAKLHQNQYNWGYDPQNYNVPEGSYATDPFRAEVRIREFKEMVQAFHRNGLGVILDVAYNHTGRTEESNFNLEVPGYYYRHYQDGGWANASGCGNETASERTMVRKFIIESCVHWATEYHLDGFRFDLMGIHDIDTMNQLAEALREVNPDILLYGEGWVGGHSPLPEHERAMKIHTHKLHHIAAFNDTLRDSLKGSVFDARGRGFVSGAGGTEESVRFGVVGSIPHFDIHPEIASWAREPWQSVSYVSCHDNHTLFDKLSISAEGASEAEIIQMDLLANAVVLTSQGIPFLHAGEEMLRTKNGEHNSYNLPDAINQIDWNRKTEHHEVFMYYKQLIALRKAHPAFSMPTAQMVVNHLRFVPTAAGVVGFQLHSHANHDSWRNIAVYYNANPYPVHQDIEGEWRVAVAGKNIHAEGQHHVQHHIEISPISMLMLFQQ